MKRGAFLLTVVTLGVAAQLRAANPLTQQWVQQFLAPPTIALPVAIAVDGHNNVFVAGYCLTTNDYPDTQYVILKYSPSGLPLWTNYYNGPGNNYDALAAMALDRAGNVFVTGVSDGDVSTEFATVAYSNSGLPLWTNRYNNPQINIPDDAAQAIAVDRSGSVCVAGCTSGYSYDTIKYSSSGVPIWTNVFQVPGLSSQAKVNLAVGKNGTVFVAGIAADPASSTSSYVTLAYSSNGVPLWTNYYNGGYYSSGVSAIAVDNHDRVLVTGSSYNFPSETGIHLGWDTIAYSAIGTQLWTNRFDGPGDNSATAIAVDERGDVFVGGGAALMLGAGPSYATVAYSSFGVPFWTNIYNGSGLDGEVAAMATDARGDVFTTGYSVANGTGSDFATLEYSRTGQPLSTNRYNGPLNDADVPTAIAVGHSGDVYVTGTTPETNGPAFLTIKYSPAKFH